MTHISLTPSQAKVLPRIADIRRAVAADLRSRERKKRVARPRLVAMYLARRLTIRSYGEIGIAHGRRHHTTVVKGVQSVKARRATDAALDSDIRAIVAGLERGVAL
jgi:chromosomal replication initiator protein